MAHCLQWPCAPAVPLGHGRHGALTTVWFSLSMCPGAHLTQANFVLLKYSGCGHTTHVVRGLFGCLPAAHDSHCTPDGLTVPLLQAVHVTARGLEDDFSLGAVPAALAQYVVWLLKLLLSQSYLSAGIAKLR